MPEQSESATEVVEEGGQPEAVNTEQESQPEAKATNQTVSVEDFKNMQSILDRQVAEQKNRNKELEQKLRELSLQNAPEEQREVLTLQQQLEDQERRLVEYEKSEALRNLSDRYGVPYSELQGVQTPQEAWGIALEYMRARLEDGRQVSSVAPSIQQQPVQQQTPFVAPQSQGKNEARDWEQELKEAQESGRADLYIALLREMEREGS